MGDVDLAHYSAALDEIYRLRCALAYEASVTETHLHYATFPKSRRTAATEQVDRMRTAARGEAKRVYADVSFQVMKHVLRESGASETLTRGSWETSR